jgi:hypothetical protein
MDQLWMVSSHMVAVSHHMDQIVTSVNGSTTDESLVFNLEMIQEKLARARAAKLEA